MTHLHFDHASGLTKWEDDHLVPAFPHAKVYVSETEWNEMRSPNIRSRNTYWKEKLGANCRSSCYVPARNRNYR